jgi:hypothetical protein
MKDLNLGPDSQRLVKQFKSMKVEGPPGRLAILTNEMSTLLERWVNDSWCWPDAAPARICGGPHVLVRYFSNDGPAIDIVEPMSRAGETFPGVEHVIIPGGTGHEQGSGAVDANRTT